jgi:hypothetical protein
MSEPRYEKISPISRQEAEKALASNNVAEKIYALLGSTYYDPDRRWVEERCLENVVSDDEELVYTAIICFGHLARIHGKLDWKRVMPVLRKLKRHPTLKENVAEIIAEIKYYAPDESSSIG